MLAFLNNYGLLITIASGVLGFIMFFESRRHPTFRRTGTVTGLVLLSLFLIALTASGMTYLQTAQGYRAGDNPSPAASSPQQGTGNTPIATPTLSPTSTPSPTPLPKAGTVSYQSGQSWSGWNGTGGWKVSDGLLLNDGTYADYNTVPTITAPYQPGSIADYAVEVKMQIVSAMTTGTIYPCIYITVRGTSLSNGWQGYAAAICANSATGSAAQLNAIDTTSNTYDRLSSTPFGSQNAWLTYRVEVKGTALKFFVDGGQLLTADDSRFLNGGQIGLRSDYMQVKISSFKIIML